MRYRLRVRKHEERIRERLRTLVGERPRWGYRRLHVLLQSELADSGPINRERIYRLYRLDGVSIRRR